MKICAISDLHGNLIDLPDSDLLLIAGDILPLKIQDKVDKSLEWLETEFKEWCKNIETYEIVLVAGNHDFLFESNPNEVKEVFRNYGEWFHYLDNEVKTISIDGFPEISIFGTPYCHEFGNWAFMPGDGKLPELFGHCPDKIDIILSHDAPYGITDICLQKLAYSSEGHLGNKELRNKLNLTDFKYLIHGHLHSSDHKFTKFKDGKVACASILDEQYKVFYKPLIFEY
jgi:Icc-related predicted phosphoesterase